MKLKHWRGLQSKKRWKRAPVLVFCLLALSMMPSGLMAQNIAKPDARIRMWVEVIQLGSVLLREEIEVAPHETVLRPVVLANGQPAILRCEEKFALRQTVRTLCQFLSRKEEPVFSKVRWAESRFGQEDQMQIQDLKNNLVKVVIRPMSVQSITARSN